MKKTFRILLALLTIGFCVQQSNAQNVGIGTTSPDASSLLELSSTNSGFLLPRMTQAQRDGIPAPATGLLIYQTDFSRGFYYYLNGWQPLGSGAGAAGAANISLSNLSGPTAINADLLPVTAGTYSLGSASQTWRDIFYFGDIHYQGTRLITSRANNLFLGLAAGNVGITATNNTAMGGDALRSNISGNWNTASGYQSLYATNGGYSNTASGFQSLFSNATGQGNTASGALALSSNTGNNNTALGGSAGSNLTGGDGNTYLGAYADGPFSTGLNNATAVGYNTSVTASNSVRVGNTAVTSIGGYAGWTTFPSDARFKKNVRENVPGLAFVNSLRPVTYTVDAEAIEARLRPKLDGETHAAIKKSAQLLQAEKQARAEKSAVIYTGFIAQEVAATARNLGFNFSGVDVPKNSNDLYGLRYAEFVVPLVKAVQELNQKVEKLEGEKRQSLTANNSLEQIVAKQQQEIEALKKMVMEMKAKMDGK